jgi:hypothetical protein
MLTRLRIGDDDFPRCAIHKSHFGAASDEEGPSLDDAELWDLCLRSRPRATPLFFSVHFDGPPLARGTNVPQIRADDSPDPRSGQVQAPDSRRASRSNLSEYVDTDTTYRSPESEAIGPDEDTGPRNQLVSPVASYSSKPTWHHRRQTSEQILRETPRPSTSSDVGSVGHARRGSVTPTPPLPPTLWGEPEPQPSGPTPGRSRAKTAGAGGDESRSASFEDEQTQNQWRGWYEAYEAYEAGRERAAPVARRLVGPTSPSGPYSPHGSIQNAFYPSSIRGQGLVAGQGRNAPPPANMRQASPARATPPAHANFYDSRYQHDPHNRPRPSASPAPSLSIPPAQDYTRRVRPVASAGDMRRQAFPPPNLPPNYPLQIPPRNVPLSSPTPVPHHQAYMYPHMHHPRQPPPPQQRQQRPPTAPHPYPPSWPQYNHPVRAMDFQRPSPQPQHMAPHLPYPGQSDHGPSFAPAIQTTAPLRTWATQAPVGPAPGRPSTAAPFPGARQQPRIGVQQPQDVDYSVSHNRVHLQPGETLQNALSHPPPHVPLTIATSPVGALAPRNEYMQPWDTVHERQDRDAQDRYPGDIMPGSPGQRRGPTGGSYHSPSHSGSSQSSSARQIPSVLRPGHRKPSAERPSSLSSNDASDVLTPASEGTPSAPPIVPKAPSPTAPELWEDDLHGPEAMTWAPRSQSEGEVRTTLRVTNANSDEGDDGSGTVHAEEWVRLVANFSGTDGENTLRQPKESSEATPKSHSSPTRFTQLPSPSDPNRVDDFFDDDLDDDEAVTWAKPLKPLPSSSAPDDSDETVPLSPTSSSTLHRSPAIQTRKPTLPPLKMPDDAPPTPQAPSRSSSSPRTVTIDSAASSRKSDPARLRPSNPQNSLGNSPINRRGSFARRDDWAFRPPVEQVYENLEEFFPNHDLDKPIIDTTPGGGGAGSSAGGGSSGGGNSPSLSSPNNELPVPLKDTNVSPQRFRHKKSIRLVAQDRKRLLQKSERRAETGGSGASAGSGGLLRRKSTKMWGNRVEEVTPGQAVRTQVGAIPESPSTDPENCTCLPGTTTCSFVAC